MRPVIYYWKFMVRDYTRLMFDGKWHFCRHCRRPVEHAMASLPNADPNRKAPFCLDCGFVDPDFLPLKSPHGSKKEEDGSDA